MPASCNRGYLARCVFVTQTCHIDNELSTTVPLSTSQHEDSSGTPVEGGADGGIMISHAQRSAATAGTAAKRVASL